MNQYRKLVAHCASGIAAVLLSGAQAQATDITFGFSGLRNQANVGSYFNGGCTTNNGSGCFNGPGPVDGVVFSANGLAETTQSSNKAENIPPLGPPQTTGTLFFGFSSSTAYGDTSSYMNIASGFTSLAFAYSLLNNNAVANASASIYSGLNGTGTLLGTLTLTPNATAITCTTHSDEFCTWSMASASNFGVGESVLFGGPSSTPLQSQEFADFQVTTVPLPSSLDMIVLGIVMLGVTGWQSRRT